VFGVPGGQLDRHQVIGSGGSFPVSVATRGNVVYVLNARDGGSVQGFLRVGGALVRVPSWHRALGLDASQTPEFTSTPGQVAFTPDGRHLVVTTKGNGNNIDVLAVSPAGAPSATPAVNADPGPGSLALGTTTAAAGTVDAAASPDGRDLYVQGGAAGVVDEFAVRADGSLTPIGSVTVPGAVGGEGIATF
jgi:DNA-binding beta-propeller fold protein YncE